MLLIRVVSVLLFLMATIALTTVAMAETPVMVNTGVDLVNRYIWRGLDIASTPSIQPSLSLTVANLEVGTWGAYTLSNNASGSDEIDFWVSYSLELERGASIVPIVTDYYFPNAGIDFFNFNNYDATIDDTIPDPGAHTVELGVAVTGPETFPLTVSAFVNVHNDAGNNTYFQADYTLTVQSTDLNFFCGASLGSDENPGYYGTDAFAVINLGVTASRTIGDPDGLAVPLSVSFILNPKAEISYLVVGASF